VSNGIKWIVKVSQWDQVDSKRCLMGSSGW